MSLDEFAASSVSKGSAPGLRRAVPSDASALASINVESWRVAFQDLLADETLAHMSEAVQSSRFERILAEPFDAEVWVVTEGSTVVGYGSIGPERVSDAAPNACELRALYLRPAIWRRGIGRRLHDHLIMRMAQTEFDRAVLWVLEINMRARAFYESLGWSPGEQTADVRLGDVLQATHLYERTLR